MCVCIAYIVSLLLRQLIMHGSMTLIFSEPGPETCEQKCVLVDIDLAILLLLFILQEAWATSQFIHIQTVLERL